MYFISHIFSSLWFFKGPSWIYILPMQSVPITTKVVSLNLPQTRSTRYNIKFVSDLWQVVVFSWYSGFLHQY